MSQSEPDRERLTLTMTALDDGLNRIARKHEGAVQFFYEDPETCQRSVGIAHWRPAEVPAGGHENCPFAARSSAHRVVVVLAA